MSQLSPEQVDALRSHDVQFGWVNHGYRGQQVIQSPRNITEACLGVTDSDYEVLLRLVDGLQTGDTYASESEFTLTVPTVRDTVNNTLYALRSKYADEQVYADLASKRDQAPVDADDPFDLTTLPALSGSFAKALAEVRALRLVSPLAYGHGQAALRGLRRIVADTPSERWHERREKNSTEVGDRDMARALGEEAILSQ